MVTLEDIRSLMDSPCLVDGGRNILLNKEDYERLKKEHYANPLTKWMDYKHGNLYPNVEHFCHGMVIVQDA